MKRLFSLLAAVSVLAIAAAPAQAILINFDDQGLNGPNVFGNPEQVLNFVNIGGSGIDMQLEGGTILTNTVNLPANQTSLYGTAHFGDPSYENPMKISFNQNINNLVFNLYNGLTTTVRYRIYDNIGNNAFVSLPNNLSGGQSLIGFATSGNMVWVESLNGDPNQWDFFVDNIRFNEDIPDNALPEPTSMLLIGTGLAGLGLRKLRRKK